MNVNMAIYAAKVAKAKAAEPLTAKLNAGGFM